MASSVTVLGRASEKITEKGELNAKDWQVSNDISRDRLPTGEGFQSRRIQHQNVMWRKCSCLSLTGSRQGYQLCFFGDPRYNLNWTTSRQIVGCLLHNNIDNNNLVPTSKTLEAEVEDREQELAMKVDPQKQVVLLSISASFWVSRNWYSKRKQDLVKNSFRSQKQRILSKSSPLTQYNRVTNCETAVRISSARAGMFMARTLNAEPKGMCRYPPDCPSNGLDEALHFSTTEVRMIGHQDEFAAVSVANWAILSFQGLMPTTSIGRVVSFVMRTISVAKRSSCWKPMYASTWFSAKL